MKKILSFVLVMISLFLAPYQSKVSADEVTLDLSAPAAVLMEPMSKKVLYSKNPKEKLYPASMTKMMGLYLVLEALDENKISLSDEVICSSYAASMGGTQIFLEENEKMTVEDLLKSVAINSANDAIVALGEYVASSNDNFVKMMNNKAKEFGMNDTNFVNATGFDDPNHYTTPLDMAILGSNLVGFGDKILKYTSMSEAYVREDSDSPFWLVNTNKLLKHYDGLDGLKTGFTQKAGYNLTATAKRNGVRLISVVMNEETIAKRSQDTIRLMDYGFGKLKCERLYSSGDVICQVNVISSLNQTMNAILKDDVDIVMEKGEDKESLKIESVISKNEPPINVDEPIGVLRITTKSNMVYEYKLYSDVNIEKPTFWQVLWNTILSFLF